METRTVTIPLDQYAVILMLREYHKKHDRGEIVIKIDGSKISSIHYTKTHRPLEIVEELEATA